MGQLGQIGANRFGAGARMKAGRVSHWTRLALALLLLSVAAGCRKARPAAENENTPVELVVPAHGAYTGAYVDFGDQEDDVTLDAIEDFETMVGKHQAIVASSSYWGE